MRKLASVRKISSIKPIPNADNLELATIDGWNVVVRKGEFNEGDICIYYEIDSFLPDIPQYEFLKKSSYIYFNDIYGMRIKTLKLRDCLSQGLILKPDIFPELDTHPLNIGDDLTSILNVIKYEPPLPLDGNIKGHFPSFIPKTEEERVQNLSPLYDELKTFSYYLSEKLDGTSSTFFIKDGVFGVCSRNYLLEYNDQSVLGKVAKSLNLEDKLRALDKDIAIQGEVIGEGINKNRYKVNGNQLYIFTAYNLKDGKRFTLDELDNLCQYLEVNLIPIVKHNVQLPTRMEDLIDMANDKSLIASCMREGIVVRTYDMNTSFKVISNSYLLKNDQ